MGGTVDMELADDGALPLSKLGAESSLRAALAQPQQPWLAGFGARLVGRFRCARCLAR